MQTKRNKLKWNKRHEDVLNYLVQNPGKRQKQCAKITNYSESHVSRIVNLEEYQIRFRIKLRERYRW